MMFTQFNRALSLLWMLLFAATAMFAQDSHQLPDNFLSKAHLAAVKEKQRMVLNIYRSLLNELKAQNKIAVADTTICALNALAMIHGFYRWYRPQGRLSREKLIDQTVALLFQGMGLRSPNGARIKKAKS